MSEDKKFKTEWSFDFSRVGEQVSEWAKSAGLGDEDAVKQSTFTEPLGDAARARVAIDFSVGRAQIRPIQTPNLIEADLTHVGEANFVVTPQTVNGVVDKDVRLFQSAAPSEWFRNVFGWMGSGQRLKWDIGLTTAIPLDLTIKGGAGKCDFDLNGVQVSKLHLNAGVGEVSTILPTGHYTGRVDCGVGKLDLVVPHGATIELEIHAGTGEVNLDIGENAAVTAKIHGGVGAFNIRLAKDSQARVEAQRGIGGLNIGAGLAKVSENVWQSAGYEAASQRTTIQYQAGVGVFNVR